MIPKNYYKKLNNEFLSINDGVDGRDMSFEKPDNIQAQLNEARFISRFTAAVYNSMELNDICSIAARALYEHAPYYRINFAFSNDLEGKTIIFSPKAQKEFRVARPKITVVKSSSYLTLEENSPSLTRINLLDNMGTITINYFGGQSKILSKSIIVSVATYFSQAVKNALEHSRMRDLAMRDGLTNLYNRRIFDETLEEKVKCHDTHPVSLLIIDLDNFKKVNDTFGHQAGDHVLKTVARVLKESCRGNDLVSRFGGEEFAIILSQSQATTAHTERNVLKISWQKSFLPLMNRNYKLLPA